MQGGTFEDGDEGIVPSTPTLFIPKRHDGFAEAVRYLQVSFEFVACYDNKLTI